MNDRYYYKTGSVGDVDSSLALIRRCGYAVPAADFPFFDIGSCILSVTPPVGEVIGVCQYDVSQVRYTPGSAKIHFLFVDHASRRHGIGSQLLKMALFRLWANGVREVTMLTDNAEAAEWLKRRSWLAGHKISKRAAQGDLDSPFWLTFSLNLPQFIARETNTPIIFLNY